MTVIIVFVVGGIIATSLWLLVKPSTQSYVPSAQTKADETNRQFQRDALLVEAGAAGKSLESIKEKLKQLSAESSEGVQGAPNKMGDAENERISKAIDAALQELPSKAIAEAKQRTGVIARDVMATNMANSVNEKLQPKLSDAFELMVKLITAAKQRGLVEVESISPIVLPPKAVVPYLSNRVFTFPNQMPALTVQFANNTTWTVIVYPGVVETATDQSKPPEFSGGPSFDITEKSMGSNLRIVFAFDRETSEIVCPEGPYNDPRKAIIASAKTKGGNFYENIIVGLLTDLRLRSSGTN